VDEDVVDARYRIYHQPEYAAMLPQLPCLQGTRAGGAVAA
jgi:hypothetical protein